MCNTVSCRDSTAYHEPMHMDSVDLEHVGPMWVWSHASIAGQSGTAGSGNQMAMTVAVKQQDRTSKAERKLNCDQATMHRRPAPSWRMPGMQLEQQQRSGTRLCRSVTHWPAIRPPWGATWMLPMHASRQSDRHIPPSARFYLLLCWHAALSNFDRRAVPCIQPRHLVWRRRTLASQDSGHLRSTWSRANSIDSQVRPWSELPASSGCSPSLEYT